MTSRMPDEPVPLTSRVKPTQKTASTVPGARRTHRKAPQKGIRPTCNSMNSNNKYRRKITEKRHCVKRKQQLKAPVAVANHEPRSARSVPESRGDLPTVPSTALQHSKCPDSPDRMCRAPAGRKKTVPQKVRDGQRVFQQPDTSVTSVRSSVWISYIRCLRLCGIDTRHWRYRRPVRLSHSTPRYSGQRF